MATLTEQNPVLKKDKTLSSQVYDRLREAIIHGDIKQGEKLRESELAARYGISRVPLREAIHRLGDVGLVSRIPHAGCRVITLDLSMLEEVYQVRMALEGMAARLSAQLMTPLQIQSLYSLMSQHEDSVRKSGGKEYEQNEGNQDFHSQIYHGSGNRWLVKHLEGKLYHVLQMSRYATSQVKSRPETALKEHRHIIEAIENKDAELAEMLMRRHISGAWQTFEKNYQNKQEG